ncbi:MAG: preprotein translocase subunit YajC [Candidatus Tokpelaia sp. JSC161]|nr:MAG: preprotein translocase subunit YajC [Candidatus Tokpelaia sp. JSC161]
MFIKPSYAQGLNTGISGEFSLFIPLLIIFFIMYFLVIRPQRLQLKKHRERIDAIRRGDHVVTAGGLIGRVTRVYTDIGELEIEIADGVRVRVIRSTLSNIRMKEDNT